MSRYISSEMFKKVQNIFSASNIFESLKILRFTTILNGLFPFYLSNDGKTILLSKMAVLMAISNNLFYLICMFLAMDEGKKLNADFFTTNVLTFVSFTYGIMSVGSITSIFIISLFRKKHLFLCIEKLFEIDCKFKNIGLKFKYKNIIVLTILMLFILIPYLVGYYLVCFHLFGTVRKTSFPLQVTFMFPYFFLWIYAMIYITFIYIIRQFSKEINKVCYNTFQNHNT